ncbi:MAG TPA: hypothetical protein VIM16_19955 [Mucilaginibacter sp.]|jgi:uncharacterized membrane protein
MANKNPFGIEDDGKTAGMLSYFFVLGWSMAFFTFHKNDKTSLSSYHLRQTLLLYISYVAIRYGLSVFFGAIGLSTGIFSLYYFVVPVNLGFIVLWIIGLNGAIKGQEKPIPIFGQQAQLVFPKL